MRLAVKRKEQRPPSPRGVGATAALAVVLTAPVVTVAGLAAWLTRRPGASARASAASTPFAPNDPASP